MNELIDFHNRRINYLRISITDRCNLRCRYCMPKEGISQFGHAGDPALRGDPAPLCPCPEERELPRSGLREESRWSARTQSSWSSRSPSSAGLQDLSITTNGILLEEFAPALFRAGLRRVNVSMDSLNPEKYRVITRGGDLSRVWAGFKAARLAGISPIKINVVAIAGFNDLEILEFARLTMEDPYQVRFIEFMPLGDSIEWSPERCLPTGEIKRRIETVFPLIPLENGTEGSRRAGASLSTSRSGRGGRVYQPHQRSLLRLMQSSAAHGGWKAEDLPLFGRGDGLERVSCAPAAVTKNWKGSSTRPSPRNLCAMGPWAL